MFSQKLFIGEWFYTPDFHWRTPRVDSSGVLRQGVLNDRDYSMEKAEIQGIVNKYQIAQFQSPLRSTNT